MHKSCVLGKNSTSRRSTNSCVRLRRCRRQQLISLRTKPELEVFTTSHRTHNNSVIHTRMVACPITAHICLSRTRMIRSEEHTYELQSLMRNSYAVFCLKKKKKITTNEP